VPAIVSAFSTTTVRTGDGLRGPIVIYDPEDPHRGLYDVDDGQIVCFPVNDERRLILCIESTVITLSDWYALTRRQIVSRNLTTSFRYHDPSSKLNQIVGLVTNNSTLINGLGRYPGGPMTPLAVINVEQGKRYRFRVIGLSCHPSYNFTIDGHSMTIIEADGVETVPVTVDLLPVLAGQRYSVIVHADKPVANYWVRALSNLPNQTFVGGLNQAILRYNGAPDEDPMSSGGPSVLPFNEAKLAPLQRMPVPGVPEIGKADVNINLVSGYVNSFFTMNNVSYQNPPIPVLLQMLSGARHPSDLLPNGSVYELPSNKVIEITIPDTDAAPGGPVSTSSCFTLHVLSMTITLASYASSRSESGVISSRYCQF
jgi:iron transport multicopper oxidase